MQFLLLLCFQNDLHTIVYHVHLQPSKHIVIYTKIQIQNQRLPMHFHNYILQYTIYQYQTLILYVSIKNRLYLHITVLPISPFGYSTNFSSSLAQVIFNFMLHRFNLFNIRFHDIYEFHTFFCSTT